MSIDTNDKFIAISDVMLCLGINLKETKDLIIKGDLQAIKIGNNLKVSEESLRLFIRRASKAAIDDLKIVTTAKEDSSNTPGIDTEDIISILKEHAPRNCPVPLKTIQELIFQIGRERGVLSDNDLKKEEPLILNTNMY